MVDLGLLKKDREIFNKFLRMPFEYFKLVRNVYPKSLSAAPYGLLDIIMMHHKMQRRSMSLDNRAVNLLYRGIPPKFLLKPPSPSGKKEVLDTLTSFLNNFEKFVETGIALYLHSPFEASAIAAGAALCIKSYDERVTCSMTALPELLAINKDFDGDHRDKLETVTLVSVLCLYMVGKEYPTEFSTTYFKQLLASRKVAGKVTVICSHLTPEEFSERYGKDIKICPVQFTDEDEIDNFKSLRKLVEG